MNNACAVAAVAGVLSVGIVFGQTKAAVEHRFAKSESASSLRSREEVPTKVMTLGTVHLPRAVKADDDRLLKPGPYQVRLAGEPLKPVVGETPNLEQWVEFLQGGRVKGKAGAIVVPASEIQQVAKKERVPAAGLARVDVLKGNQYMRVWINKGGNHYLIHLPLATTQRPYQSSAAAARAA